MNKQTQAQKQERLSCYEKILEELQVMDTFEVGDLIYNLKQEIKTLKGEK
jgi:hypothetical protein